MGPDTVMRNTMVAAECAAFWHLLGLSFSFPNWPESHDVRYRFSLLASFSWQASCSLFSPWTVGIALGLRRRELRYRWFQPSPAQIGRRHRFQQAPSPRLAPPLLAENPVQRWRAFQFRPHRAAQKEAGAFHQAWRRRH